MTSMQPYLLRALYAWMIDNSLTPYLLINAEHEQAHVPTQYIEEGKIILNIAPQAIKSLALDNDRVHFSTRFSGNPFQVSVPIPAVLAIYAKENGKGMFFKPEDYENTSPPEPPPSPTRPKPVLKRVK